MRFPWSLGMISTRSFIHTPTQLYVVPRSIPTAFSDLVVIVCCEISLNAKGFVDSLFR